MIRSSYKYQSRPDQRCQVPHHSHLNTHTRPHHIERTVNNNVRRQSPSPQLVRLIIITAQMPCTIATELHDHLKYACSYHVTKYIEVRMYVRTCIYHKKITRCSLNNQGQHLRTYIHTYIRTYCHMSIGTNTCTYVCTHTYTTYTQ